MRMMRAWAWGDLNILACSMPGSAMSEEYIAAPVTFSRASRRSTEVQVVLEGGRYVAFDDEARRIADGHRAPPRSRSAHAAASAAFTVLGYVPHLQRLPAIASRTSCSTGVSVRSRSAFTDISMPGM